MPAGEGGGPALARRIAPVAGALAVRVLARTLRLRTAGVEPLVPLWTERRPLIYALWHGRILLAPWVNARLRASAGARPVTVLASRSRDGELVARFVARFGLAAVRGSSSRGGAPALRALTRIVHEGHDVVVVPDGPRGPEGRLKAGVVALAAATGAPIVPLAFGAWPALHVASWDRFLIPWPFARAAIVFGAPLAIRPDDAREVAREVVQRALEDTTARADMLARDRAASAR